MNLEQVAVVVRPRNQWEAIDAGVIVARRWFLRLWFLWFAAALPLALIVLLLCLLLPGSGPTWALILFWFGKPLVEPALLHWAGRALFGEQPTVRETGREMRGLLSWSRIRAFCFLRFSPSRSFSLPVPLLEGLTGKDRHARLKILGTGYETAIYLTGAFFILEILLLFAILAVLFWLIPEELRSSDFGPFVFRIDDWLIPAVYFLTCSLVTPFYICGGFMLYISRRVELEAWDIEIGFKRIDQRLKARKTVVARALSCFFVLCLLSAAGVFPIGPAGAAEVSPETAKTGINQVLQQKDFGEKTTVYRWVPKQAKKQEQESEWSKIFASFFDSFAGLGQKLTKYLADISRFVMWIGAGGVLAFIFLRYAKMRPWLTNILQARPKNRSAVPVTLFGMNIRPESLPEDVVSACLRYLQQDEKRQALSLLYRATLSRLIHDRHLRIGPSSTEYECRAAVNGSRPEPEATYFGKLTAIWLKTAYGHQEPEAGSCAELIGHWQRHFGG